MTLDDLAWVAEQWPGNLVVKGIQTVEDAVRVSQAGADAIVLSNHGGRQLDRATTPLRILADVRQALPADGPEIWLDSGITSGADVVVALALGADFTLVGRSYLYGLMAGGGPGVDRVIAILRSEIEQTMRLLGVTTVDELGPQHVHV